MTKPQKKTNQDGDVPTTKRDLWVDFNEIDVKLHVSSLLEFARPGARIEVGGVVLVGDDEGNRCKAEILGIDSSGLVELVLDGDSFVSKRWA